MKCFVHVGFDPKPHEADDPAEAISLAERRLLASNEGEEEHLPVRWRRDDLYPDNFLEYTQDQLVSHLSQQGEVVLQLAELDSDGLPIMGEIANIFTASEEEKNAQEADEALEKLLAIDSAVAATYKKPKSLPRTKPNPPGNKQRVLNKRTMKPNTRRVKRRSNPSN
jgi:hypothetical protein